MCAARPAVRPAAGHRVLPTAGRRSARSVGPPRGPAAPPGSGDTTRVAARARSTECRTGSTPGSPDQISRAIGPSPGGDAGSRNRASEGSLGNYAGPRRLSTVSTGLSTDLVECMCHRHGHQHWLCWLTRVGFVDNNAALGVRQTALHAARAKWVALLSSRPLGVGPRRRSRSAAPPGRAPAARKPRRAC